eukprot:223089_1
MHNALKGRQRRYALKPCPRDTVEMDILWNLQRSTDDNDLHPNIIKLYHQHSKYKPDVLFMALEYMDTDLKFLLSRSRHPLPTPLIKYVMYNIANGLCEDHRLNIVHRDMKLDKYVFDAREHACFFNQMDQTGNYHFTSDDITSDDEMRGIVQLM